MGQQQLTQELQLSSSGSSQMQWIGGLYLLTASAFEGPVNVWAGVPVSDLPNAAALAGRTEIRSYAGYGQASYELPNGLKLIAGLRTSYEQRRLTEQSDFTNDLLDPTVRAGLGLPPVDTSTSWTSTKPTVTLQWKKPGQLLYASYSTGFKAGSYNLVSATSPGPLDPEDIRAYEIGGKHDLPFLHHGHVDWAAFHYNYRNIQVSVQDPGTGGITGSQNAASSIHKGFDVNLAIPLDRTLTVRIGMEYLDARYRSFQNASVPNIINGAVGTSTAIGPTISVDASGNRMERSPWLTSSAQLSWQVPVSSGDITATAAYYHNSGFYFDPGNEFQQKAYDLANFRIQYAPRGGTWAVAAWINNAFNATVVAGIASSPYVVSADYTDPRLFGLSASIHL